MADYTYKELMRMQDDAVRRVADMQRRARETAGINETSSRNVTYPAKETPRHIPQPQGYLKSAGDSESDNGGKVDLNLLEGLRRGYDSLSIDEDRALILSLVLLLSKEHADESLLTALLYMLT